MTLLAVQGVRYLALDDLAVMDPTTMRHVASNGRAIGEVMMRGNMVMRGYAANEEATAAAFTGGWFHSGDLAVRHPDGYIEIKVSPLLDRRLVSHSKALGESCSATVVYWP